MLGIERKGMQKELMSLPRRRRVCEIGVRRRVRLAINRRPLAIMADTGSCSIASTYQGPIVESSNPPFPRYPCQLTRLELLSADPRAAYPTPAQCIYLIRIANASRFLRCSRDFSARYRPFRSTHLFTCRFTVPAITASTRYAS